MQTWRYLRCSVCCLWHCVRRMWQVECAQSCELHSVYGPPLGLLPSHWPAEGPAWWEYSASVRGGVKELEIDPFSSSLWMTSVSSSLGYRGRKCKRWLHQLWCGKSPLNQECKAPSLPGCSAASWWFTPPPPPLHGVPCLSVCCVSCLSVSVLSAQFVC